jgi:hypothetical protein
MLFSRYRASNPTDYPVDANPGPVQTDNRVDALIGPVAIV